MFFKKATSGQMTASQYAITIIAVIIGYIVLGQIPLTLVLLNKIQNDSSIGMDALDKFQSQPDFSIFGMDKNIGLFLMLCIFIFGMLALWLGVKYAHKMAFKRLITSYENINWGKILFAFGFWFILALLIEGGFYFLNPAVYSFHFDLGKFIPLLLLAIFVLPIQTSFEELFFRGYLMPGMGLLTKNKWLPLIITSVLFGLIHGFNPEVVRLEE